MDGQDKQRAYDEAIERIRALIAGETDRIAVMATVVGELHHGFAAFDWTGFYRAVAPELLKVGPYQGGHGCLAIPFERGVCAVAADAGGARRDAVSGAHCLLGDNAGGNRRPRRRSGG